MTAGAVRHDVQADVTADEESVLVGAPTEASIRLASGDDLECEGGGVRFRHDTSS
jgi:hypothetical protein